MRCAPTASAALMLCAATAGLLSAQGRPAPPPEPPRFASWDEVNVLAHGLLQLGHGLREHVERTRGQLGALERRLGACGAACEESGGSAAPPRAPEGLVPSGEAAPDTLRSLQTQLKTQNSRIEQLFHKVAQQQRHLEKQHLKIQTLQSQVGLLSPKHLGHGMAKPARKKRLPKIAQLIGPAHNISRLHRLPRDCQELFDDGERQSGLFQIQPQGSPPFLVNCKMTSDGGWTVIQRRQDGSVDFNQPWEAYKAGFGDPQGEFWLGLEKVHRILGDRGSRLAVQLQDWEGNAESLQFPVHLGGEDTAYSLQLTAPVANELGATTVAPSGLSLPFSTWDQDHDLRGDKNCAKSLSGGWWFGTCGHSNLNGQYFRSVPPQRQQRKKGIFWKTWRGRYYPLQATTMLIQPTETEAAS
ncbi:angiopoietin-related protein 4 [Callorhinus ursinus]|uniref:Angiopoietin-related protein 4 isoform X1 n=1 Tax=Callorhinus ursinus TaxID=34884 RepID=A0A3Q7NBL6_CALUR|nr:angiopoietin-related protein 4 isoform X1 [Callorhinus ursinus]XP_027948999.1 angiopoietin-related protein 4 isoform X1 [Eumetopias jubatus]